MQKRPKITEILLRIGACIDQRRFFDTRHATDRKHERSISRLEVLHILKYGRHEKAKDQYQERYQAWNYAIRGKSLERRDLRIIVSFDEDNLLIMTAIEVSK